MKRQKILGLWVWVLMLPFLQGCFGSPDTVENAKPAENLPPLKVIGSPSVGTMRQDDLFVFKPNVNRPDVKIEVVTGPEWLTVDDENKQVTGVVRTAGNTGEIHVRISAGGAQEDFKFSFDVIGDPVAHHAWHLENVGQKAFAQNAGTPGMDIRAKEANRLGFTGKGIIVAVSDTGLEIAHEDLAPNVQPGSRDFGGTGVNYEGDPTNSDPLGDHGTAVGGIIGARGWNEIGSRGVAPEVGLVGFNYLLNQAVPDVTILQASGPNIAVFNQSWGRGVPPTGNILGSLIDDDYKDQLTFGFFAHRNGKGSLYVRSAGNDYLPRNALADINPPLDGEVKFHMNACVHEANTHPYVVVAGAIRATGVRSSYSSTGSCLWVAAPGGQYGLGEPAIMTTDQSGCNQGYSKSVFGANELTPNDFAFPNEEDPNCNYTTQMNGTSSAAPNTSGAIALIFQANPALTAREVKYILAKSARKIDADRAPLTGVVAGQNLVLEQGWVTNAAGVPFHNWYGFGLVDAASAVTLARNFERLKPLRQTVTPGAGCSPQVPFCSTDTWRYDSGALNLAVPLNATGITSTIPVTENYLIEAVQIRVSASHQRVADLQLELTSPSGTKSIVINGRGAHVSQADYGDQVFLTNAFLDEPANGVWTLRVIDTLGAFPGGNVSGTLTNWKINIIGREP